MATLQFNEGDVIAGKYRVERCLGEGGMGAVLAARHMALGQRVAIKVMHPELAANEQAVLRFTREGQAAARLQSMHVTRVLDVGQLESGAPYLVMEYLDGKDLSAVLQARGPMPLADVAGYLLQAGEALVEAHAAGIVHRDLKPANLFLTADAYGQACIKVLDFGISKLSSDAAGMPGSAVAMTATSVVMGSPLYMPPEQMRSTRDADARSDVWALGVILYELLTARPAWTGETLSEVCVRVATDPAPSVRSSRTDLPPGIDVIIARCLQKDPTQRYQQVIDFMQALAPFAGPEQRQIVLRLQNLPRGAAASLGQALAGQNKSAAASSRASLANQPGVAPPEPAGTGVAWGSQTHVSPTGRSRALKWGSAAVIITALAAASVYWKATRAPTTPATASASMATVGSITAAPAPDPSSSAHAASLTALPVVAAPSSLPDAMPQESAPRASAAIVTSAEPARQRPPIARSVGKPSSSQSTKSKALANPTVAAPDWGGRQ
jgi:serine/threonine-protein kinase